VGGFAAFYIVGAAGTARTGPRPSGVRIVEWLEHGPADVLVHDRRVEVGDVGAPITPAR
jgi:hypothetical protein